MVKKRTPLYLYVLISAALFFGPHPLIFSQSDQPDREQELDHDPAIIREILQKTTPDAPLRFIAAVADTPRAPFVPEPFFDLIYSDIDIPVQNDSILPSPSLILRILSNADISPNSSVLIIGKGTGYIAAAAARIADEVTAVEFSSQLLERYTEYFGKTQSGPLSFFSTIENALQSRLMFDSVIVHGATFVLQAEITSLLRPSGTLVVPLTGDSGYQTLLAVQYGNGLTIRSIGESFFPVLSELTD